MAPQREWFEKDYYRVLGVSETASKAEVTKEYRKLARDNHPDRNPGDTAAEERFKEISAAYDVLGDDAKRKEYDEVRRMGPLGGMGGPGGGAGGWSAPVGAYITRDGVTRFEPNLITLLVVATPFVCFAGRAIARIIKALKK